MKKAIVLFFALIFIGNTQAQEVPDQLKERYSQSQHPTQTKTVAIAIEESTVLPFFEVSFMRLNTGLKNISGANLDLIADQVTSTNTVRNFWNYAREPKEAIGNSLDDDDLSKETFEPFFQAQKRADGLLKVLEDSLDSFEVESTDIKQAALAQLLFVRGLSRSYLGLLFDQAAFTDTVYFETSRFGIPVDSLVIEFRPYSDFIEQGLTDLDSAITILDSLDNQQFKWILSDLTNEITRTDFLKIIHSFKAKILISTPRTSTESINYNLVLNHAYQGLNADYSNFIITSKFDQNTSPRIQYSDYYSDWTSFLVPFGCTVNTNCSGYLPNDVKVMHLLDNTYPVEYPEDDVVDGSPTFREVQSDDPRLAYFKYTTVGGFLNDTRGKNLFSNYYSVRQYADNDWQDAGLPIIYMTRAELQYIIAEAEFMLGNIEAANTALQNSPYGSIAADFDPNLYAVDNFLINADGLAFNGPQLGNDYDEFIRVLHKEYAVEIGSFTTIGTHWFFMRRHGLLQEYSPTQLPMPASLLDNNGLEIYTFGGVQNIGEYGTADGSNAWKASSTELPRPTGLIAKSRNKEIVLSWDEFPLAFTNYRLTNSTIGLDTLLSITTSTFTQKGLMNGITYEFSLSVVADTVESDAINASDTPNIFGDLTMVPYQDDIVRGEIRTIPLVLPNFADTAITIHSIEIQSSFEDSTNRWYEDFLKYGYKNWREDVSLSIYNGEIPPKDSLEVDVILEPKYFGTFPFNLLEINTSEGVINFNAGEFIGFGDEFENEWSGYYSVPDTLSFGSVNVGDSLSTNHEVENNFYWSAVITFIGMCTDFRWPCDDSQDFSVIGISDTLIVPTGEKYSFNVTVHPKTQSPQIGVLNKWHSGSSFYTGSRLGLFEVNGNPRNIVTSSEEKEAVSKFELFANYPNPFNPSTNIQFTIPQAGEVSLEVFNLLGQKVQTLVSGRLNAGLHSYIFDASQLSSGVYFYRIEAGSFIQTRKMLLIK